MQNITKTKAQHKTEKKNMVMFPGNCIYIFLLSSGFFSKYVLRQYNCCLDNIQWSLFFNACRFSHEIHLNSIHFIYLMLHTLCLIVY